MDDKLIFDDVEELVTHMFDIVDIDEPVTVIADKDLFVDVMQELLTYKDIILDIASVDSYEYDKEYRVTLTLSEDDDCWHVLIDPAYNDYQDRYFGISGHLLFHEDINSKAQVNILNNNYVNVLDYNWFIIGEDDGFESDDDEDIEKEDQEDEDVTKDSGEDSNTEYTVTVKCNVDPGDVMSLVRDVEHSVLHMYEMFDEMNRFRRLLRW